MKKYGLISDFALIRKDMSRTVIGYGLTPEEDGEHATWHEVVIYKKKIVEPNIKQVKEAVQDDIDDRTDARILNGYPFTPDGAEESITVWLSKESQTNFSEAHRLKIVPVKFKLNETADKQPIYHTFETFDELNRFYVGGVQYINQFLNEGWSEKDSIDWSEYEEALENPVVDSLPNPEPRQELEPESESEQDQQPETDQEQEQEPASEPEPEAESSDGGQEADGGEPAGEMTD